MLGANIQAQTTFFVSPGGNDTDPGIQSRPFATINRALAEARKIPGDVVIYLMGGTYYLSQPVVFTPADAGKENKTLILTNFDNRKVIISGSVTLHLTWKKYKNNIWQAHDTT